MTRPATEAANPLVRDLDLLETRALVELLAGDQQRALVAVAAAAEAIAAVVDATVERLRAGGRLHYFGAGTSGRLAMLDAAECPPTFGTPPELVQAHVAGGSDALQRAIEGAEDDAAAGAGEAAAHVRAVDAVIGISAAGTAPYVLGAVRAARELGAYVAGMTSDARSPLAADVERAIVLQTGAEPIAGSTRLGAGTAQKVALNAISTATMVRLGRVYDNVMVDVVATNAKLRRRALELVVQLAACDAEQAAQLLAASGGSVKVAVVMHRKGLDAHGARELLVACDGFLRRALD